MAWSRMASTSTRCAVALLMMSPTSSHGLDSKPQSDDNLQVGWRCRYQSPLSRNDSEAVTDNESDGRNPYDGTQEAKSQNVAHVMAGDALPRIISTQHHGGCWPRFIVRVLSGILIGSLDPGI